MYYINLLLLLLPVMTKPKTIELAPGAWTRLGTEHFCHATNGEIQPDYPTQVELKVDATHLYLAFRCRNDRFVSENTMFVHNQPLYNQEVFEVFIAPGQQDPAHYLEVEINPNNALWIGRISNPGLGDGSGQTAQLVDPSASGIRHRIRKGKRSWRGELSIPWDLIGADKDGQYRLNFYRIVSRQAHVDPNWTCDVASCDFLCWSATLSGAEPAFHRPKKFGNLTIKKQ